MQTISTNPSPRTTIDHFFPGPILKNARYSALLGRRIEVTTSRDIVLPATANLRRTQQVHLPRESYQQKGNVKTFPLGNSVSLYVQLNECPEAEAECFHERVERKHHRARARARRVPTEKPSRLIPSSARDFCLILSETPVEFLIRLSNATGAAVLYAERFDRIGRGARQENRGYFAMKSPIGFIDWIDGPPMPRIC